MPPVENTHVWARQETRRLLDEAWGRGAAHPDTVTAEAGRVEADVLLRGLSREKAIAALRARLGLG